MTQLVPEAFREGFHSTTTICTIPTDSQCMGAIHLFATMIKIRFADTLGGRTGLCLTLPRTFQREVVLLVQKTPQHTHASSQK